MTPIQKQLRLLYGLNVPLLSIIALLYLSWNNVGITLILLVLQVFGYAVGYENDYVKQWPILLFLTTPAYCGTAIKWFAKIKNEEIKGKCVEMQYKYYVWLVLMSNFLLMLLYPSLIEGFLFIHVKQMLMFLFLFQTWKM